MSLALATLVLSANAQLDKTSTFEKLWLVETTISGKNIQSLTHSDGFGPAEQYRSFSKGDAHSTSDLLKIIADTPFLSLELPYSKPRKTGNGGDPRISLQPHPWDSYKKLGNDPYSIVIKKGESFFLIIPSQTPKKLQQYLIENGGLLKADIEGLKSVDIKSSKTNIGSI